MAAGALQGALGLVGPQPASDGADLPGEVAQDVVQSLTRVMLTGAALSLTDLGVDCAPEALRSGAARVREPLDRVEPISRAARRRAARGSCRP